MCRTKPAAPQARHASWSTGKGRRASRRPSSTQAAKDMLLTLHRKRLCGSSACLPDEGWPGADWVACVALLRGNVLIIVPSPLVPVGIALAPFTPSSISMPDTSYSHQHRQAPTVFSTVPTY